MGFLTRIFGGVDNFRKDAAGFVANQSGHFVLGLGAVAVLSVLTFYAFGYRATSFWALMFPILYFVLWELARQGWSGADTVADALFVGLGSFTVYAMSLNLYQTKMLAACCAGLAVALTPGALRRLRA